MAIVSDDFVFLHIPKTGGIWATQILTSAFETTMLGHQHSHFPQLLQIRDEEWYRNRFIFTMIRHPITWYQSRWAFRIKHGWQPNHPLDFNCASNDFHTFVDNALKFRPNGWLTWLYGQYINNVPGGIDFIARLEYCQRDLELAMSKAGCPISIDVLNSKQRTNDSDMGGMSSKHWAKYTPELFDRVMTVEHEVVSKYYNDYKVNPNDHIGRRAW